MREYKRLLLFGDSLIDRAFGTICESASQREIVYDMTNGGVGGQTSAQAVTRLTQYRDERYDLVVICLGMNDQARKVPLAQFSGNLSTIVDFFEQRNAVVWLATFNPVKGPLESDANKRVCGYIEAIRSLAQKKKVKLIDIYAYWCERFSNHEKGLCDAVHHNDTGKALFTQKILDHVMRPKTIILWQYNGNPAECNYSCPYCLYNPQKQKGHHFQGDIGSWRRALYDAFGNQHLVLYLAHGEPMCGERFYDVLEMIGGEKQWEGRMTTNLSRPIEPLVETLVFREGRFNINASFHPTAVDRRAFLRKLLLLRQNGVEPSIVYVFWPPFKARFEDDIKFFADSGFVVHIRRFQGVYKGRSYPENYTETERQLFAKYADNAMLTHMLSFQPSNEKLTWTGVDFVIMDNMGNIGYCDNYRTDRYSFGNIFKNTVKLYDRPRRFPAGKLVSDGTVDGVANFNELNYSQLTGNNVLNFSRQGGVYKNRQGEVIYGNKQKDFNNSLVRAEYLFPVRHVADLKAVLLSRKLDWRNKKLLVSRYLKSSRILVIGVLLLRLKVWLKRLTSDLSPKKWTQ